MKHTRRLVFVLPALLNPRRDMGGGIELIDLKVATILATDFETSVVGPCSGNPGMSASVSGGPYVDCVRFPPMRQYPPRSRLEAAAASYVALPLYAVALSMHLPQSLTGARGALVVHNGLPGLAAALIARHSRWRVIYSEGNTEPWTNPCIQTRPHSPGRLISRAYQLGTGVVIAALANAVRAQSASIRMSMTQHGIRGDKIVVIPGGVDTEELIPNERGSRCRDTTNIGFIGRLTDEKGARLLREIVALAADELPRVRFVIIGDGPWRKPLEAFPNVHAVGWLSKGELRKALIDIDAVVFFQSELGLAELETLAAGKVLIACGIGEIPTQLHHMANALLCEPSPQAYVSAIRALDESPKLLRELSASGRQLAISKFDWRVTRDLWKRLVVGLP